MAGPGKTGALPRSLLHLRFLIDNGADPDVVFYRDEALAAPLERAFPGRTLYLDREKRGGRSIGSLLRARGFNRAYYPRVGSIVAASGVDRLILFLEGEPLERYLVSLPQIRDVELWEDGLSHYVDLTSPLWYAARGAVQALSGYYPKGITSRRMDRSQALVRDRFEHRNLRLAPPPEPREFRDELLLIGSPLVEDGIIRRVRFVEALRIVAGASPVPVRYLPHPRESIERRADDLRGLGIRLEANSEGLMDHAGRYAYRAYIAAISTGLLDLGRPERCIFVPGLFGLKRMERVLGEWEHVPVALAGSGRELAMWMRQLAP